MPDETSALRIIDAAANRAGEGLRVIEDYLRLALDDCHLTLLAKQLRHDLVAALAGILAADRHAARDTLRDVGTQLNTPGEQHRAELTAVAAAAFKRVEQALRSLEEFSKLIDPRIAGACESLRYRVYTLERAAGIAADSIERLTNSQLYVLIDAGDSPETFGTLANAVVEGGADLIQLRDKRLADRVLLERARQLREITTGSSMLFIMNDRPDLAVLARADGVHVGQDELPVKEVRAIVGPKMLIGVSTHSLEQAKTAALDGASYIGVGPTFASTTKGFSQFTGLELLRQIAAEISLPAFAIGGIAAENVRDVLKTGIKRIAVSGAVQSSADPAAAVKQLRALLG